MTGPASGGWTYPLYSGSLLCYNHTNNAAFVIASGAILGIGASFLWVAQGAVEFFSSWFILDVWYTSMQIMVSYPLPDQKGRAIALFWVSVTLCVSIEKTTDYSEGCIQPWRRYWVLHFVRPQFQLHGWHCYWWNMWVLIWYVSWTFGIESIIMSDGAFIAIMGEMKINLAILVSDTNSDISLWLAVFRLDCPATQGCQKGWYNGWITPWEIGEFYRGHPSRSQQLCDVTGKLENSLTYSGILLCQLLLLLPTE